LEKPIIAAVHGYALGAGCEYAMICDIRIAAEGAKFGFPEASVGAPVTTAGTQILPRLVGLGRAKEMIFTSELIDAKEAERIGLVNKVVPLAELDKAAEELARKIAKNSPMAIRLMRAILDRSFESSMDTVLQLERNASEILNLAGTSMAGFEAKKKEIAEKK
jgi:enoyl-CoA hydratase